MQPVHIFANISSSILDIYYHRVTCINFNVKKVKLVMCFLFSFYSKLM